MDKAKVVEYVYLGGWVLLLLVAVGISWGTSRRRPQTYRGLVPVFGLLTFSMILVGVAVANHFYPTK